MQPAAKLATYADLVAMPDEVKAEIVAGEVVTAPSPLPRHSRAAGALIRLIGGPFDQDDGRGGPGGWWILSEVDVALTVHDIVRPDVSGWRRERLQEPWDTLPITVVPDWICEIVSPSNAAHDRVTKLALYLEHSVAFYWLVDPAEKTLEAFRRTEGHWVLLGTYGEGARARIAPFEQEELEVARLFPPRSGA